MNKPRPLSGRGLFAFREIAKKNTPGRYAAGRVSIYYMLVKR